MLSNGSKYKIYNVEHTIRDDLIIKTPIQNEDNFNIDDFTTYSERVKKSTQDTVNKMESRVNEKIYNVEKEISSMKDMM